MAYRWPAGTTFKRIALEVEDRSCPVCDRYMHVCDHRYHALWTFEGPTQVVNRLVRCPDTSCQSRGSTFSPEVGCRTSLSCISKWFGGICSRLLRLRTGKRSSAFRLHGFTHLF